MQILTKSTEQGGYHKGSSMEMLGLIITIIGGVIGGIAAIFQVVEHFQKKRGEKTRKDASDKSISNKDIDLHRQKKIKQIEKRQENSHEIEGEEKFVSEKENKPNIHHNLPARAEFIGRKDEKRKVHEALCSQAQTISIDGIGGVGKTSLALEIAHGCLSADIGNRETKYQIAEFEGIVWITTKGPKLVLEDILNEIARTFGDVSVMKQSFSDKKKMLRSFLSENHCLLIVDNYEIIEDKAIDDFLDDLPISSKVLITTRERKLYPDRIISLKGLQKTDALSLIRNHGNNIGISIDKVDYDELVLIHDTTDGHPLAIRWALGQIKQKGQDLDRVLERLQNARSGNELFDKVILLSWNLLTPHAQRVLRIMPVFFGDASEEAIKVACLNSDKTDEQSVDDALDQLVEMSLIGPSATLSLKNRRYSIHPLTRAFARAQLDIYPEIEFSTRRKTADYFEKLTQEHGGLWNLDGFDKLKPDTLNILESIRWCWQQEETVELGVNIFHNVRYFLTNNGLWNTAFDLAKESIKFFEIEKDNLPDHLTEWQTKTLLFRVWPIAWIYRFRSENELAKNEVEQVLSVLEKVGDEENIIYVKRHLSLVLQELNDMKNAERLLKEALEFSKSIARENDRNYRSMLLTADLAMLALKRQKLDLAEELRNEP